MAETEKNLERKLNSRIKDLGGWSIKLFPIHVAGLPDRLCLLPGGKLFFAEVKGTHMKPRKIQVVIGNRIRALGFRVEVIDSTEKLDQVLNGIT